MSSAAVAGTPLPLPLLRACLRYWPAVASQTHAELSRCERAARTIPDAQLRALALRKLNRERLHPQLAATFATLAPRRHRPLVIRAAVGLQVAYDYLDLLTELPGMSLEQADRLLGALPAAAAGRRCEAPQDGGYLDYLLQPLRTGLERLPAAAAVRRTAIGSAERCAQAQALTHCGGEDEIRRFAQLQAAGGPMQWQEALAAASASVLCLHALIAAAADPATTPAHAAEIESMYRAIGALAMLDSLLDRREDRDSGQTGYLERYADAEQMADRLVAIARRALTQGAHMRHGAHHVMTLAGVIAHYGSAAAGADRADGRGEAEPARIVMARLRAELGPLLRGPLAVMEGWRAARAGRQVAGCIVSRCQRSAPRSATACSDGGREAKARGFHANPLGEGGS